MRTSELLRILQLEEATYLFRKVVLRHAAIVILKTIIILYFNDVRDYFGFPLTISGTKFKGVR